MACGTQGPPTLPWACHHVMVVKLASLYDPKSYAAGHLVPSRFNHARVPCEGPREEEKMFFFFGRETSGYNALGRQGANHHTLKNPASSTQTPITNQQTEIQCAYQTVPTDAVSNILGS